MNWWTDWESNPARVACKASLRPGGRPKETALSRGSAHTRVFSKMVLGRGFEPRSPALQAGAFTRLAFRAHQRVHVRLDVKMVWPARIELASSERHSEALPIDQGRM